MSEVSVFNFRDRGELLQIVVSNIEVSVRVFFNLNCYEVYLDSIKDSNDYRIAFATAVHYMYLETEENSSHTLLVQDFINTSDENLYLVMNTILHEDDTVKRAYDELAAETDAYKRFHVAHEEIMNKTSTQFSSSVESMAKKLALINPPTSKALESMTRALSVLNTEHLQALSVPKELFQNTIPTMAETLFQMPKLDFGGIADSLAQVARIELPQMAFTMADWSLPLNNILDSLQATNIGLAETFRSPLEGLTDAVQSLLNAFSSSFNLYTHGWTAKHRTLIDFGWTYSSELPDELVEYIDDNKENLSQDDVDKMIVDYFRQDKCKAVKDMVKKWSSLSYFKCRENVFHQALVNHSRKYYNAAITLMTIHTEGLITDFIRIALENPKFHVDVAIKEIKKKLDDCDWLTYFDYKVYIDILDKIESAFLESFKPSDPDSTSNNSRHKIAHGHMYSKECEANSLKQFLYVNELYNLFLEMEANMLPQQAVGE